MMGRRRVTIRCGDIGRVRPQVGRSIALIAAILLGLLGTPSWASGGSGLRPRTTSPSPATTGPSRDRDKKPPGVRPRAGSTEQNGADARGDGRSPSGNTSEMMNTPGCPTVEYGDVSADGSVDLEDVICILDGFAGDYRCPFAHLDVAPCGGDGVIDLDDTKAVLDAFEGTPLCPDPCRPCVNNQLPAASAGADRTAGVGQETSFHGGGSSDLDGFIVRYEWSFGDGQSGAGANATHAYSLAGAYTVTLTTTDDCGATNTDSALVTVGVLTCQNNVAPRANAGPNQSGAVGQAVTFNGLASTDPGGVVRDYWWSFDDGTSTGWQSSGIVQHTYTVPRPYEVQLWVRDNCQVQSAPDTVIVTVGGGSCLVNVPPTADAGPSRTGEANLPVTFDGSGSFDPGGSIELYEWTFGDGGSGSGETIDHEFATAGTYTIRLTVTDNCGASSSQTTTATIGESTYVELTPQLAGYVRGSVGHVNGLALSPNGQNLYVESSEFGVLEFDVTTPGNPTLLRTSYTRRSRGGVAVSDSRMLIGSTLGVASVLNGPLFGASSSFGEESEAWDQPQPGFEAQGMVVRGTMAYVAASMGGLKILDLSNPQQPSEVGTQDDIVLARGVALSPNGQTAYVAAAQAGVHFVSVADPASPMILHTYPLPSGGNAGDVVLNTAGTHAFVAENTGLRILDTNTRQLVGFLSVAGGGARVAYSSYSGGRVLMTSAFPSFGSHSLAVVDVSAPTAPRLLASVPGEFGEIDASGRFVYMAAPLGVELLDLVDNPGLPGYQPQRSAPLQTNPVRWDSLAVSGDMALAGGAALLTTLLDVSDPTSPQTLATMPFAAQDVVFRGNRAYLATGLSGLMVVDIDATNPSNPAMTTRATIGSIRASAVALSHDGRWAFVGGTTGAGTNRWGRMHVVDTTNLSATSFPWVNTTLYGTPWDIALNEAGDVAMLAEFGSGLQLVDVGDPRNPQILGSVELNGAIRVTALRVGGRDLAAVVKMQAEFDPAGLLIVDVSDPENPATLGFVPGGFNGVTSYEHYALAADASGFVVVDLFNPEVSSPPRTFVDTLGQAFAIVTSEDKAYVTDEVGRLDIFELLPQ